MDGRDYVGDLGKLAAAAAAKVFLGARHPDWEEYAWAMMELARRLGPTTADPVLYVDDLYHIVSNAPGCAAVEVG